MRACAHGSWLGILTPWFTRHCTLHARAQVAVRSLSPAGIHHLAEGSASKGGPRGGSRTGVRTPVVRIGTQRLTLEPIPSQSRLSVTPITCATHSLHGFSPHAPLASHSMIHATLAMQLAQSQSPLSHSCLLFIVSLTPMPDFPAFEDGEAPPDFGSPLAPPFPTALTLVRHRAEPSDFRPSFHGPRT